MFAVITCPTYWKDIDKVANHYGEQILYQVVDKDINIVTEVEKICRISVKYLILDISSIDDKSKIIQAIRRYRIKSDKTRVIIIAPDTQPGNSLISSLVAIGVYDIINPQTDTGTDIYESLINLIDNPSTYAKAARWDIGVQNDIETPKKETTVLPAKPKLISMPNKLILVANLSKRAGSTFISVNLARYLSFFKILPAVIEPPITKPYIFDYVGINHKLNDAVFRSIPHLIYDNMILANEQQIIDDILWLVPDPRKTDITNWSSDNMINLLFAAVNANVSIVDAGSNFHHECIQKLIGQANKIFIVVDPLPVECMQNQDLLKEFLELKGKGFPVEFIFNRWNTGVDSNDLALFISEKPDLKVPYIDGKLIYGMNYKCEIPVEHKLVEQELKDPFFKIARMLLPNEYLNGNVSTKRGILPAIFRKER